MLERIIDFTTRQRLLMVVLGIGIAALGMWNFTRLPIDAVPDVSSNLIQINTAVSALTPLEIEKQITYPIESAMGGIPGVQQVRSLSKFGLSQVAVTFDDDVDIYRARQMINERLTEAKDRLPLGTPAPVMGPVATGLGEVYMWAVEATGPKPDGTPYTLTDLHTIQEWVVKPQMRTVRGVTEVNTSGGFVKQYHVMPDAVKMAAYGISYRDVTDGLAANNANTGGGYIEQNGDQYLVRSTGLIASENDIRNVSLGVRNGVPLRIGDVSQVGIGHELRTGAATLSGQETVIGTAIMLIGENSRVVSRRVDEKLKSISAGLPKGVKLTTLYDRTYLVDATLETVFKNLFEGAILVAAVLFVFLGNFRAAFIVVLAIPLSMLFAVTGMVSLRVTGNLMSLGAIDFGIIIDGAVVMVENIMRRIAERQQQLQGPLSENERIEIVNQAAIEVCRPTLFGELIIAIVYLPILTLGGIAGKMFVPMALVVLLALLGALILSFTLMPALAALLLTGKVAEKGNTLTRWASAAYRPALDRALKVPWFVATLAVVIVLSTGWLATRLGGEFVPRLNEGAVAIEGLRVPSISLTASLVMQRRLEEALLHEFPDEISMVYSRIGTSEVATDPMGVNSADTYANLKPLAQWTKAHSHEELRAKIDELLQRLPGEGGEVSQPIEMRVNELISGIKSNVAVKIYGDDTDRTLALARRVVGVLKSMDAADIKVEQVEGMPVLNITLNRKAISRFGLNVKDVQDTISTALGGTAAGQIVEGDRFFDLVVRLPESRRGDIKKIELLPIMLPPTPAPAGATEMASMSLPDFVPLSALAKISIDEGPNEISHEDGKRRIVVQCNARGRDLAGFVAEAQEKVAAKLGNPPEGYWIGWGGQFENLIAARERLTVVVPVALLLIFILLYAAFNSVKHALLVFTGVPLALTGGVLSLWLRGLPFSITAGIGFIALSGVAVLNGLVMLTFINQLRREGAPLRQAILDGCLARLRPVLMTAFVASLGFVPMALATGTGAEVQRPLATVVIGGVISAALLTLIVLPVLYWLVHRGEAKLANEEVQA